ncbi:small ribosomal subunit protein mS22 [Cylas formicarius]|uniref:small ribosomal subunit protein mS22 n=1 Tax=Cylas formicarius TaxID=197179 RepID=UPI0029585125|nr:small ribosomal subunit protein mS22 [Cylas formicarius]
MASVRCLLGYYLKAGSRETLFTKHRCHRLLNYTAIPYDHDKDPAPLFFSPDVQQLLSELTRADFAKVFRKRKLGRHKLAQPEYKFMTDKELNEAMEKAKRKAAKLLQIPPVVSVRKPVDRVLSRDPALLGLDESRFVFTDITYGIKDRDRLVVVREPDGTLREAEWELRKRVNQIYFPMRGRALKTPKMFDGEYLADVLSRKEYEFILEAACVQFEPDDPEYQRVVSITYQHINDNHAFDLLRSTRHFGALTFFLVWNKCIDNLLQELIGSLHLDEAVKLLRLYSKIHHVEFEGSDQLELLEDFARKYSVRRGALELVIQACRDTAKEKEEV